MEFTILAENLQKSFGKIKALDGVSFAVPPGLILALLGPNGAGKTTLIRILATLLRPDSGTADVFGHSVSRNPQAVREVIGLAGQYAAVDEFLTGRENLELVGRLYHLPTQEMRVQVNALIERFDLTEFADRLVKTYSGGMRRRLDLAASLVGHPQVLFLDEPTAGLDPRSRRDLWKIIQDLRDEGSTILLTTQYMEEADHLADYIIVLDRGRVIASGSAEELKKQIGGARLEIKLKYKQQLTEAARSLADLGSSSPQIDEEEGKIILPVASGAEILPELASRLDIDGIQITELNFHQPIFLHCAPYSRIRMLFRIPSKSASASCNPVPGLTRGLG